MKVPQADTIDTILDLPLAIAQGANTKRLLAKKYDFDERQADYYLEANEILELVSREDGLYILTEEGKKYTRMDPTQQKLLVIRRMLSSQIMANVVAELVASEKKVLSKDEIETIIEVRAGIHGKTVPRRAHTLMVWFRWIGEEVGVFVADRDVVKLNINEAASKDGESDEFVPGGKKRSS